METPENLKRFGVALIFIAYISTSYLIARDFLAAKPGIMALSLAVAAALFFAVVWVVNEYISGPSLEDKRRSELANLAAKHEEELERRRQEIENPRSIFEEEEERQKRRLPQLEDV
jgi:uncharacterized protein YlxW (UPF0749 family)